MLFFKTQHIHGFTIRKTKLHARPFSGKWYHLEKNVLLSFSRNIAPIMDRSRIDTWKPKAIFLQT